MTHLIPTPSSLFHFLLSFLSSQTHPLRIPDIEGHLPLHIACLYGGGKEVLFPSSLSPFSLLLPPSLSFFKVVHAFMHRMLAAPSGAPIQEALGRDHSGFVLLLIFLLIFLVALFFLFFLFSPSPSLTPPSRFTPLHYAAMSGNVQAAVTLIQEMQGVEERGGGGEEGGVMGRFLELRDRHQRTALHLGYFLFYFYFYCFFLWFIVCGYFSIFIILISSPFHSKKTASMAGRTEIVCALLGAGAQISVISLFLSFSFVSFFFFF